MQCTSCGGLLRRAAKFCPQCGAEIVHDRWAVSPWMAGGAIATALAVVAAALGAFLLRGDDESVDGQVVRDIQAILDGLPHLEGETDLQQMRSLLGPPDAFTIFLERLDDGRSARREEWFYFDYYSVYSFLDGKLQTNLPLADPPELMILPRHWDPGAFELGATWESLAGVVKDPGAFESFEFEDEFEVPGRYYVGNQLVLVFDEDGHLYYVEAVPLEPGVDEDYEQ